MMESTAMNYLAVLVAGVVYTALGALWYSPALFGNAWMKGIGKTKEQVAADYTAVSMLWALIAGLITAYGIARVLLWRGTISVVDGLVVGVLAEVCFVGTTLAVNNIIEKRPSGIFYVNWLYNLIGFAIMGIIIGAWK